MKNTNRIGVIKESESAEFPIAIVRVDEEIYPSKLVLVEDGKKLFLALVTDVWCEGGVFNETTASYHLDNLDDSKNKASSTHKVVQLHPIAQITEDRRLSSANERILIFPGAVLFKISSDQIRLQADMFISK